METQIFDLTFKKVNDKSIAVYQGGSFQKEISYPAKTKKQLIESAHFYFIYCH